MKLLLFKKITSLIEFSMIQSYIKSLNEITSQHNRNISHLQRAKKKEQLKRLRKAAQQKWNLNSTFKNLKELEAILFYFFVGLFPPVLSQPVVWRGVSSRNKPVRMEAGIPEAQYWAVCRKWKSTLTIDTLSYWQVPWQSVNDLLWHLFR